MGLGIVELNDIGHAPGLMTEDQVLPIKTFLINHGK
jgi:hypothetical protein